MNKAFRRGNALWIILAIISLLCVAGLLFILLQEKEKRVVTEQRLLETTRAKRQVELNLDAAQSKLVQLKDEAKALADKLEEEKKNYKAALDEVNKRDTQLKELENSLANEKKQSGTMANGLARLKEEYNELQQKLKQANQELETLKSEAVRGNAVQGPDGVELKKIIVKSKPKKILQGKILVVNNEFRFVVTDIGKKDGVSIGDELVVYNGSREVGKVQVEKVYDAMSTAAILEGSEDYEISENSAVKSF